jgi:hypothetical protein
MHPPGRGKEDAAVWSDRVSASEDMPERRHLCPLRVDALGWLGELLGVAQENQVVRRRPRCAGIGKRHLTRFVDDEHVQAAIEPFVGEEP